jgi:DNA-binding LacI/PurR family transcriptional regulator
MPPLTTVRQDFVEVGHRAIEILQAAISGVEPDSDLPERLIEPDLVVRASTAALVRPKRKVKR